MLLFFSALSLCAQWQSISGTGYDIGVGANGTTWVIGTGNTIHRWNGTAWQLMPGNASRIDVNPAGNAWVVNEAGNIFRWNGSGWTEVPGAASDIGIGANGTVWAIGRTVVDGGFNIMRWTGAAFQTVSGGAVRIDVDPSGNAWVVNNTGVIFKWNGSGWTGVIGQARDITVGADGAVWSLGRTNVGDGYAVSNWTGSAWNLTDGALQSISAGPRGVLWGSNTRGMIWTRGVSGLVTPRKGCIDWPTRQAGRPLPPCDNCSVQALSGVSSKFWATGSTLRVKMIGGSAFVRGKVQHYANQWSNHANIRFNFINEGDAEIIVTFGNDGLSYSKLGTDAVDFWFRSGIGTNPNETMHFGWFTDGTSEAEFQRVILHEFGHALGFIHEHNSPTANIPWNREAVYAAYSGPPNNWSRAEIDQNFFGRYDRGQTQFSQYDPHSIMHYAIAPELTTGGFSTPWNTNFSATDMAFARAVYPPGRITGNRLKITVVTGSDDLRVNSQAYVELKFRTGPLREMRIPLNRGAAWAWNSTNYSEIATPNDVSIGDVTECKVVFESGKQFLWDTPDNWNVDRLKLEWVTSENFATTLSEQSERPFIRFANTGSVVIFNR